MLLTNFHFKTDKTKKSMLLETRSLDKIKVHICCVWEKLVLLVSINVALKQLFSQSFSCSSMLEKWHFYPVQRNIEMC